MVVRNMSNYRELPPPPELVTHLTCVWHSRTDADGKGVQNRIVPDGCIDIVWIGDAPPKIAGPATIPIIADLPPGARIVGVRFHPGMASSLLGLPADELLNMDVMLQDVWGQTAERLVDETGPDASVEARLSALRGALVDRLPEAGPRDEAIHEAIVLLDRTPTTQVQELSRRLGIGQRQLLRRFSSAVGYGPKTFGRILRFQQVRSLARQPGQAITDLASLAFATGYADQAHMTREFSRLAGVPPSELLATNRQPSPVSDSFKPLASANR